MAEIVNCPQCQRQLRVPDDLLGKRVRCPSCNTTFTATPAGGPAAPESAPSEPAAAAVSETPPSALDERYQQEPGGWEEEAYEGRPRRGPDARKRALSRLKAPAICLLVTGIIGLFVNGFWFVRLMTVDPKLLQQEAERQQQRQQQRQGQPVDPQAQEMVERFTALISGPIGVGTAGVCLAISILAIAAAICMLTGKLYAVAVAGSVLAMFNVCGCCVFAFPFGIWSLIVLLNNDVKAAFG